MNMDINKEMIGLKQYQFIQAVGLAIVVGMLIGYLPSWYSVNVAHSQQAALNSSYLNGAEYGYQVGFNQAANVSYTRCVNLIVPTNEVVHCYWLEIGNKTIQPQATERPNLT